MRWQIEEINRRIEEMQAEGVFPSMAHVQREYWGAYGMHLQHITITVQHISDIVELIALIPKDWTMNDYEHSVHYWSPDWRTGVTFRF